jgi:hypothetical protein
LKIKDINLQPDETGQKLCAILEVGRYGKKEEPRTVDITELSLQYYEPYLNTQHPNPTNREAFIFVSRELSGKYRNTPIGNDGLRADYKYFKTKYIPKLLKRPDIPDTDKEHLQHLKDTKKWHPYIMRHSSLNKIAPHLTDYQLRRHGRWTKSSQMVEVYTHGRADESAEDVLLAYGVNIKGNKRRQNEKLKQEMTGPLCPFCHTPNIPDSQFCSSCRRPISIVSMNKLMQESDRTKQELQEMKAREAQNVKLATELGAELMKAVQAIQEHVSNLETKLSYFSKEAERQTAALDDPKKVANMIANLQLIQKYMNKYHEPLPWAEIEQIQEKMRKGEKKNKIKTHPGV